MPPRVVVSSCLLVGRTSSHSLISAFVVVQPSEAPVSSSHCGTIATYLYLLDSLLKAVNLSAR